MRVVPTHELKFIDIEDDAAELPSISDPIYIYKEGEEVTLVDLYSTDDDNILGKYLITGIKQEIYMGLEGDQVITFFIKKINK